jgi:hypothetical protein
MFRCKKSGYFTKPVKNRFRCKNIIKGIGSGAKKFYERDLLKY